MSIDTSRAREIYKRYPRKESSLVMILQDIQSAYSYLPLSLLEDVARYLALPTAKVYSVATFYKVFSLTPQGRTLIQVCKGTACHIQGAAMLQDEICRQLNVKTGQATEDLAFTVKTVNCVGACTMAPVITIGENHHGPVNPSHIDRLIKKAKKSSSSPTSSVTKPKVTRAVHPATDFQSYQEQAIRKYEACRGVLSVCGGPSCLAAGADNIYQALIEEAKKQALGILIKLEETCPTSGNVLLSRTGCQGYCQAGPLVHWFPNDIVWPQVSLTHVQSIVTTIRQNEKIIKEGDKPKCFVRAQHPFYSRQEAKALSFCGKVNPDSLEHYLAMGGFNALQMALKKMTPKSIVNEVEKSGLRGRGGAGFLTGRKWLYAIRAARQQGVSPFLICNGDEGDPGAFMDRALMEGAPFQIIEGMLLGALALGASHGFIYVRAEYPVAVTRLENAIQRCRKIAILGSQILGTSFSFDIEISRGGGAFVCGESTALMQSIEGKVGEPRAKYVRSVERGLYNQSTVLNNVETWALIPGIVFNGASWLSAYGTEHSKGTKVFSLTGKIQRNGLVEIPMGTTLRELIYEIGGGLPSGCQFKAVQTGGPSGGFLPAAQLDIPIDFDALQKAGSMMGSGGMIVMDNCTCMVNVAKYFIDFLQEESCGKCVPCRLGLPQMSMLLSKFTRGIADPGDCNALESLGLAMQKNALCGLGKSAPNPILSTLQYFRHEYDEHIHGKCVAGVCKDLIHFKITDECVGCLLCIRSCPSKAISGRKREKHLIDQSLCTRCGICKHVCQKYKAVSVQTGGIV